MITNQATYLGNYNGQCLRFAQNMVRNCTNCGVKHRFETHIFYFITFVRTRKNNIYSQFGKNKTYQGIFGVGKTSKINN